MVEALIKEIVLQKGYLPDKNINTIYLGGGTPSILTTVSIEKILSAVYKNLHVDEKVEITLEANPDDLDLDKLKELKRAGINRLSIGIQSFNDNLLQLMNRAHKASEAISCVKNAQTTGFDNISIDLIYAVPGLSINDWREELQRAVDLNVRHISSYSLTIEKNTVFGRWKDKGTLGDISEEVAALQFEIMIDILSENGFDQYEVSNFAKPGFISKHNSNYWQQIPYLGIGPSAHSFNGQDRQFNISHNTKYVKAINQNQLPCELDKLTTTDHFNEYIMTRLRTCWGIDLNYLKSHFNYSIYKQRKGYITDLIDNQLAYLNDDKLILTKKGKLLADQIAEDLFEDKI